MKKQNFHSLSFGKKIVYIWRNYCWHIFLASLLIVTLCSWVWEDYICDQPLLQLEMIDGSIQTSDAGVFDAFLQENGHTDSPTGISISKKIQIGDPEDGFSCSPYQLLFCSVNAQQTDLYFWDDITCQPSLVKFSLVDLREVLSADILEQYREQLIYSDTLLNGGYPCGIDLTDSQWLKDHPYYESCAVGIDRNTENPELAAALLTYMLR